MVQFFRENKIILALSILLLIPLISMFTSKNINWELSLKTEDKQPFGLFVFDSLMRNQFGSSYQNVQSTLYEIHTLDSTAKTVIVLADYLDLSSDDLNEIIYKANNGYRYIFAANNFSSDICKKMNFEYANYQDVVPFWFSEESETEQSSIEIINDYVQTNSINTDVGIVNSYFYEWDTITSFLLKNRNYPIAIENNYQKGSVIICSSSYLFTNYFILDKDCWRVTERLLMNINRNEIIFTNRYLKNETQNSSIFKNIIRYDALKYLLYFSMFLLLIYMVFSAKRKQRVIPVIKQHKNNSLEFIKLIGRLYFLKKNHSDICIKKFQYLKDYLHRTYQINFNEDNERILFEKISIKTGVNIAQIKDLFYQMNEISTKKMSISISGLHKLVKEMEKFYIKK